MADGAGQFSIVGGTIGNREAASSTQAEAVRFVGASDSMRITGVDMAAVGSDKPPISYLGALPTNAVIESNLPRATAGANLSARLTEASYGALASNTTLYFGHGTPQGWTDNWLWSNGAAARVAVRISVFVTTAPGAAQSFTYTLMVNGVATAFTGTISGAGSFSGSFTGAVPIPADASYDVQVVSSSGAAATVNKIGVTTEP